MVIMPQMPLLTNGKVWKFAEALAKVLFRPSNTPMHARNAHCLLEGGGPSMTMTMPRSVLLGMAVTALITVGFVPAAGAADLTSAAALRAAAPTPTQVLDGPECPDVMVIAARGSGEAPSNWENTSAYTSD